MISLIENLDCSTSVERRSVEGGDGLPVDHRRDSVEGIVDTIAGNVPLGRFETLKTAMVKKLIALKAAEKTKTAKAG